jgi:acetyl-CoA carboxylase biotin carboxyl carrier protein
MINFLFCIVFSGKSVKLGLMYFYSRYVAKKARKIMVTSVDTKLIGRLAEVLNRNNLGELEYEDEGCHIRMKSAGACASVAGYVPAAPVAAAPTAVAASAPVVDNQTGDDYAANPGTVKSPIVGVVYLSPDPTKPDYVNVGDSVKEGDIVCLIEAMKTFNPVKAHRSGTVSKILVESGDPVEYGESLLVIE